MQPDDGGVWGRRSRLVLANTMLSTCQDAHWCQISPGFYGTEPPAAGPEPCHAVLHSPLPV